MRRVVSLVATVSALLLTVAPAIASEGGVEGNAPDYSGISYMYYTVISLILVWGVYDTFFRKA
jgi:hypothetical protein